MASDFSQRRAAALARMAAYTLALVFLIALAAVFLPPPFLDPQRMANVLVELLERSTLPLVSLVLLFLGFSGRARPALWECRLVGWLRPLLLLLALLYLFTAVSLGMIGQRLEADGIAATEARLRRSQAELQRARDVVAEIPDEATLRAWLNAQPALRQALAQLPEGEAPAGTELTRSRIDRLLAVAEANLQRDAVRARAAVSGQVWGRMIRSGLTALVYALFFAGAFLVWPRSLLNTRQLAWRQRSQVLAGES